MDDFGWFFKFATFLDCLMMTQVLCVSLDNMMNQLHILSVFVENINLMHYVQIVMAGLFDNIAGGGSLP